MLLEIDDAKTFGDLQERFNLCFPNLKIEFYNKSHHWKGKSEEKFKIEPDVLIGKTRKNHEPGVIEIKSWHKTGEIEQKFKDQFGLHAQIFYSTGNIWKQSIHSDGLTLAMLSKRHSQSNNS